MGRDTENTEDLARGCDDTAPSAAEVVEETTGESLGEGASKSQDVVEEETMDPEVEAAVEKEQNELKKNAKVFPPPITWYNASAATSRPEMFAYIGKNSLVVGTVGGEKEGEYLNWPAFMVISQQEWFKCIDMSQQEWDYLPIRDSPVVTGDDGGHVKIWNVNEKACVMYHASHKRAVTYVAGVQWSPRDPNTVISIDSGGALVIWKVKEKTLRELKLETPWKLNCLAVSPHEDNIVAVGAITGNILVVDVAKDPVTLYKMHHEEELISLSWVPTETWDAVKLDAHHVPPLLISAVNTVNEPTIRVWDRAGNDVAVLKVTESEEAKAAAPPTALKRHTKTFVPCGWVKGASGVQLYTSVKDVIVVWNSGGSYEPVHSVHSGIQVFAIIQTGDILWSFGRESMAIGWNLKENKQHLIIPMIRGVCCAQTSNVVGTEVAIGGSDGILRVLSMHSGYPSRAAHSIPVQTSYVDSSVTSLAWHPQRDNVIGLGTAEGVLGLYEYQDENRFVRRFEKRVKGKVYSLDWGPPVYSREWEANSQGKEGEGSQTVAKTFNMYVCANDSVYFINPSSPRNSLICIIPILRAANPSITERGTLRVNELRWCPNKTFLSLGYFNGRVEIYKPPYLQARCVISCHKKYIQHLLWRPYDFESGSASLSKWLACASSDGKISLYNLASLYTRELNEGMVETIRSPAKVLDGHSGIRVISVAWSPSDPKLLVSVSYDQTAVVWDVGEGTPLARYCGHTQRLVACLFHPSDPYSVVTFSDQLESDFSAHVWDYREHPYQELQINILKKVKAKRQALKIEREEKEQEPFRLERFVVVSDGTGRVFDGDDVTSSLDSPNLEAFDKAVTGDMPLMPLSQSYLEFFWGNGPVCPTTDEGIAVPENANLGKIQALLCLEDSGDTKKSLIKEELNNHVEEGNWEQALSLADIAGTSDAVVEKAMKTKALTEAMVIDVMTGSYSVKFRVGVIEAYICKLKAEGRFIRACQYMLKIGQETEAIRFLRQRKFFLEALTVAQQRLPEDHPSVCQEIYEEWTCHLMDNGHYFKAFKLQCALGNRDQALNILKAWNTPEAFKLGIPIAVQQGRVDLAVEFGLNLIEHELICGNHDNCKLLVETNPSLHLEWYLPVIQAHERLVKLLLNPEAQEETETIVHTHADDPGQVSSRLGQFLHSFIPQTRDEALVHLAKLYTIVYLTKNETSAFIQDFHQVCKSWFEEHPSLLRLLPLEE